MVARDGRGVPNANRTTPSTCASTCGGSVTGIDGGGAGPCAARFFALHRACRSRSAARNASRDFSRRMRACPLRLLRRHSSQHVCCLAPTLESGLKERWHPLHTCLWTFCRGRILRRSRRSASARTSPPGYQGARAPSLIIVEWISPPPNRGSRPPLKGDWGPLRRDCSSSGSA